MKTNEIYKDYNKNRLLYEILYKFRTDEPIAVIEAKRKGQSLEDALDQAIKRYANPLEIKIVFAIDGTFIKSLDLRDHKELSIDKKELKELVSEQKLLRFLEEGSDIDEVTAQVKYTRDELIKTFKWANELLRKEGIQKGLERFTAFSNLLFIKVISELEDDKEKHGLKRQLKKSLCWDSFAHMTDEEAMLNYINNTVLKNGLAKEYNHSDDIFQEKLKIQSPKTVKQIVNKLSELILINTESEIKGDAFEYFLKSLGAGNDLGEYFTPRHIVRTMVTITDPKFGNVVFDPFCGTGGFLIEAFRHIKRGIDEDDVNLMEKLKKESIFGVELTETYKIAKMNMIITGDGHNNIVRDDTAKNEYWDKFIGKDDGKEKVEFVTKLKKDGFDVILSNIPYSQPTDYGALYPIPSNQGDSIFIQHLILNLKKGGICAVIVPEGFLFKKEHKKTREYLLKECEVEGIISLPAGVFLPYTNVKTYILVFKKGSPTKKVWFFKVESDGFELNTSRKKMLGKNDLDVLIDSYKAKKEIKDKSFSVNIDDIEKCDYELAIRRYEQVNYNEVTSENPSILMEKIINNEKDIDLKLDELMEVLKNDKLL